ncbi:hypothetical protein [Actinokineospora cianjurensis]|uniref:Uncharacterized protein n=1 Tax=Actinokineospora cianjurensis TaxID=585224 RepID=A0A421AVK9_9PSEU|nr:hypothetical protein [Actinokineospora cianjurensis]RLK54115.1 hypothetical protein CLV68_6117 [Actinokineospora cianjurensis]
MTKPDNEHRLQTEDLLVDRDTEHATTGTGRKPDVDTHDGDAHGTDTRDGDTRGDAYRDGEDARTADTAYAGTTHGDTADTARGDSAYRDSGYADEAYSDTGYGDRDDARTDPPNSLTDPDSTDAGYADPEHTGSTHAGVEHTGSEHTGSEHTGSEHTGVEDTGVDHAGVGHAGSEHTGAGHAEPEYTENAPTAAIPEQQSVRESGLPVATDAEEPAAQLFSEEEVGRFREQWQAIQTTFVDDPQDAVRGADHLVAEVMQALAATFTEHKRGLEEQWQGGSAAQTEDLRLALRRYRSFFHQLLHS